MLRFAQERPFRCIRDDQCRLLGPSEIAKRPPQKAAATGAWAGRHDAGGQAVAPGVPKLTLGASRSAAEVTSKNSRCLKPSIPAKILVGNCKILVLRSRTTAL